MSFGWSAGDIAAALTLAYSLIDALDSVDGAADDYREAVSFLGDLRCTLGPLGKFPDLAEYPGYGKEISQQVSYIKEPVETLLQSVVKYESSLGADAAQGRHRHIISKIEMAHTHLQKGTGFEGEDQVPYASNRYPDAPTDFVSYLLPNLPCNPSLTKSKGRCDGD